MNKNYFKVIVVASAIAVTTSANAQVAITKNIPPVGTKYTHGMLGSGSVSTMPETGAGKVWDYSSINVPQNTAALFEVVAPSSMPSDIQTAVPNAEFAVLLDLPASSEQKYSVYDESNDTLYRVLNQVKTGQTFTPLYNSAGIEMMFNTPFNGSFQRGTTTYEYAGYGTLKLGANTYDDVVMFELLDGGTTTAYFFYQVLPFYFRIGGITPNGAIEEYRIADNTTGIQEFEKNIISVYPNPTNSTLNIEVKETANIKIVNMLGATVATQQLNAGTNSINVSSLTNGIYFIQSSNGGAVKFIKE